MGQFKPMVKMMTTEPSVELKLKKGGKVEKKMQMGGNPEMAPAAPAMRAMGAPARGGMMGAQAPMKPSLMARRKAMRAMPAGAGPAGPAGMAGRMMKEGGETSAEHMAEMRKMAKTAKKLEKHKSMPASKAHKGLKSGGLAACATGGVVMGQGGYKTGGKVCATGGVVKGQGGYKKGGNVKKYQQGGVTEVERQIVRQAPPVNVTADREAEIMRGFPKAKAIGGARPGSERLPKAIGRAMMSDEERRMLQDTGRPYVEEQLGAGMMSDEQRRMLQEMMRREMSRPAMKKGGAAKKAEGAAKKAGGGACYAKGGAVNDSGKAEKMPQGHKRASTPVSINQLSGTFKKGGAVMTPAQKRLSKTFKSENASAMKAAKKMSNEKYGR